MIQRLKHTLLTLISVVISSIAAGQEVIYETGFESGDGFSASTSYTNTDLKLCGPYSGLKWGTICGTATKTESLVISGNQSMHIRYGSSKLTPYCMMEFSLNNVASIEFEAKGTQAGSIKVEYSTDDGTSWAGGEVYEISTSSSHITYTIAPTNNVRFKISSLIKKSGGGVSFDDVVIKSGGSAKTSTNVSFGEAIDGTTIVVTEGEEAGFTAPTATLTPAEAGAVSYESSNTSVATVDPETGVVELMSAPGETTITATFAGNDSYEASSAHYKLLYKKDTGDTVFYESFDKNNFTGGNDGRWSNSIANGENIICDNTGWTLLNEYGANKCLKLGTTSAQGSAETPALSGLDGDATLTFNAGAWDSTKEKTTINISISGGGTLSQNSAELKKGAWQKYTIAISDGTPETKIKFRASSASNNRFFLDEVTVVAAPQVAKPTASVAGGFYAEEQSVALTAADGCTIYYTLDGEAPGKDSQAYTAPIAISTTTTLKAMACDADGNASAVGEWHYQLPEVCNNIASAKAQEAGTAVRLTLRGAQVLYAKGDDAMVRDASGAMPFRELGLNLAANDTINGSIVATVDTTGNLPKLTKLDNYTNGDNLTVTNGEPARPVEAATLAEAVANTCNLVTVTCRVATSDNNGQPCHYLTQGDTRILLSDKFGAGFAMPYDGALVEATGIIVPGDGTVAICPIADDGLTYYISETENNTLGEAANASVKLKRKLVSGCWNSFCVPFAIDPDQLAAVFGDGTKVSVFTGEADGTVMQFRHTDRIEAATPCLIMPAQTTADPTFTGVTLAATEAKSISTADGSYKFTGTYSPKTLATDGTDLFITQDGSLKKPSGTTGNANLMKGMRAYITIPGGASATAVRLNISPTSTAMRAAATDGSHSPSTFNLAGQKVDAPGKGIYIRNGKKFIMK